MVASGSNLLYIAIAKRNLAEVTRMIEQTEMTANTIFTSWMSALQIACQYEQAEQVDFLLKHGADVNYQVSIGLFTNVFRVRQHHRYSSILCKCVVFLGKVLM